MYYKTRDSETDTVLSLQNHEKHLISTCEECSLEELRDLNDAACPNCGENMILYDD